MSKIEWTNETWNPIIGCSKISPGCANCYAEKMAKRLENIENTQYYSKVLNENGHWNGRTLFIQKILEKPLKRKKPTMYFVCSMGDLFHESVPFTWIDMVIDVIKRCPQHTFQILTKRPERMFEYFHNYYRLIPHLIKNLWLGVTAENQEQANKRIPILLQIPAKIKFVSIEPMLEMIDIETYLIDGIGGLPNELSEYNNQLNLVICGGESGNKAMPMHPDWVINLQKQCEKLGVPFFFKQWGEWSPSPKFDGFNCKSYQFEDGKTMYKVGKKQSGCILHGKEYKQFPK